MCQRKNTMIGLRVDGKGYSGYLEFVGERDVDGLQGIDDQHFLGVLTTTPNRKGGRCAETGKWRVSGSIGHAP